MMVSAISAVKVETNLESEVQKMAYKCLSCGHVFEEGEQACWTESRGEYWGSPCYETMSGCPVCKEEYDRRVKVMREKRMLYE